jgi:hypothetical protein
MTKIREFMTGWESPDTHQMMPLVWSDRSKEGLRGTAKASASHRSCGRSTC